MIRVKKKGWECRRTKISRLKPFWWGVLNIVLAAVILVIEPDSISDAIDEYSYEVFSKTVGGPLYPAHHSDDIGVVLLDNESLAGLKSSWPAVYGLHAEVLRKLFLVGPKAVFIDFTFRDRRTPPKEGVVTTEWLPELYVRDDSLTMLVNTLQMYQMVGIPVYLQAGALNFYQHHAVLSELAPYVTLVSGWGDMRDHADTRALSYSLFPELRNAGQEDEAQRATDLPLCDNEIINRTANGDLKKCDVTGIIAAAPTIYQDLCSEKQNTTARKPGWVCDPGLMMPPRSDKAAWLAWRDKILDRPMWLSWPDRYADYQDWTKAYDAAGNALSPYKCGEDEFEESAFKRVNRNLLSLFGLAEQSITTCAPFHTISAEQVFRETPQAGRWIDNFKGRVVMYGQNLQGFQDIIRPPTIDIDVPGVFVHAMALENLLSNGSGYLSDRAGSMPWLSADLIEVLTLTVIIFLRFGLARIARQGFPASSLREQASEKECNLWEFVWSLLRGSFFALASMICFLPRLPTLVRLWWKKRGTGSDWANRLTPEIRHLTRNWFMFLICLVDLMISVTIVTLGAIILEFSVLSIAPVNWLAVISLGMLSYIPFVRSLFTEEKFVDGVTASEPE